MYNVFSAVSTLAQCSKFKQKPHYFVIVRCIHTFNNVFVRRYAIVLSRQTTNFVNH